MINNLTRYMKEPLANEELFSIIIVSCRTMPCENTWAGLNESKEAETWSLLSGRDQLFETLN